MMWTLEEGVALARQVQAYLQHNKLNLNCALGGGVLMKGGSDKDLDLFLYRHKTGQPMPDSQAVISGMPSFSASEECDHHDYGDDKEVFRCVYNNKRVDLFFLP